MKSRARKMNRWFLEEVMYLLYYPDIQTGGTIGPYDYAITPVRPHPLRVPVGLDAAALPIGPKCDEHLPQI
jgi:hypothetical protein